MEVLGGREREEREGGRVKEGRLLEPAQVEPVKPIIGVN